MRPARRRAPLLPLLCGVVVLLLACSSKPAPTSSGGTLSTVASISVALDSTTLGVSHQAHASATARDANGNVVAGAQVTWSSSNPGVAAVTASGVVTAVAAGSTN